VNCLVRGPSPLGRGLVLGTEIEDFFHLKWRVSVNSERNFFVTDLDRKMVNFAQTDDFLNLKM